MNSDAKSCRWIASILRLWAFASRPVLNSSLREPAGFLPFHSGSFKIVTHPGALCQAGAVESELDCATEFLRTLQARLPGIDRPWSYDLYSKTNATGF